MLGCLRHIAHSPPSPLPPPTPPLLACRSKKVAGVTRIANLSGREVSHLARVVLFCLPGLFDGVLLPDTDAEVRRDCLALQAGLIEFYSALLSWTSYCFLKVQTESSLEGLQQAFGVVVDKSIEISDPADLTEAWLTAEVYGQAPSASGATAAITAKAAPRGGRRLIRKPKEAEASAAEE